MEENIANMIIGLFQFAVSAVFLYAVFKGMKKQTKNIENIRKTATGFDPIKRIEEQKNSNFDQPEKAKEIAGIFKFIVTSYILLTAFGVFFSAVEDQSLTELFSYLRNSKDGNIALFIGSFFFIIAITAILKAINNNESKNSKKQQILIAAILKNSNKPEIQERLRKIKRIKSLKFLEHETNRADMLALYKDKSEHWYRVTIEGKFPHQRITKMNRYS